jgi:hypothetical protein
MDLSPGIAGVVINVVNLLAACAAYPVPSKVGRKTILTVTFGGQTLALFLAAFSTQQ